ncbi:MAG: trypsin-like peptidase domain-containing protein [Proteobacteria bacterium]|nr:trypsin-like peptidase domain-containing protein [Pseudomonadota bacterium]
MAAVTASAQSLDDVRIEPADGFARIRAVDQAGQITGSGSAVAIMSGLFLSACHVVAGASQVVVVGADGYRLLEPAGAALHLDLCLLSVASGTPMTTLTRRAMDGSLEPVSPKAEIRFVGLPNDSGFTVSRGHLVGRGIVADAPLLLTDAPLKDGMSGGGLFDTEGRLVGIAVGRNPISGHGVGIDLAQITAIRFERIARWPAADARMPPFFDIGRVWPDYVMALATSGPVPAAGGVSRSVGNWLYARQDRACEIHARREAIGRARLALRIDRAAEGVRVSLDVGANDIPERLALSGLAVTLLPREDSFVLRAQTLRRSSGPSDLWDVEWQLADAAAFLRALPRSEGLIASLAGTDIMAVEIDPVALWQNIRETCF